MLHAKFGVQEKIDNMDNEMLRKFLRFRCECIQEEVDELLDAVHGKTVDAEETVDALIDICVFAIGTLDLFNVNAGDAWDEVLQANMKKEIGVKKERPNPFGLPDLIKPEGWEAPNHEGNHGRFADID
tara:strand:- start:31 stop:414 length:384 start_codon:yes stop_codon:yes gene_type:complete